MQYLAPKMMTNQLLLLLLNRKGVPTNQEAFSGSYKLGNAEEVKTHFTRVLYAVESNEKDAAPWNDAQLVYDSKDPQGNNVKVKRFQFVTKT